MNKRSEPKSESKTGKNSVKKKNLSGLVDSIQFGQMFGLAQKLVDQGVVHPKVIMRLHDDNFPSHLKDKRFLNCFLCCKAILVKMLIPE